MHSNILSVHMLNKRFRQGDTSINVLDGVTAIFRQGASYAITGPSGSGKSTLIQLLAGLDLPTMGQVRFNKKDLRSLSLNELNQFHNLKIGLVFQQPQLIRELSVIENVMVPGMIAGLSSIYCCERAQELLDAVGILDKADHKPGSLSGGQQQRLVVARALFNKPAFLLADEPTGNLDLTTGKKIIELLLSLMSKYHMGIIISTHDQYVADSMQQQFELKNGILYEVPR